ncbi:hypothetical protein AS031_18325 [Pseudarthrobacter enclensis]|uniref:Uncharacterized protein n=1 Tax=Pseudarthrobacter enclensis TaxID=993070 RepID=A0A0V8I5G8_9MICC|nr:hypothetical protein AS031_18325 [Pseudarthrobacter enclensis]
MLFSRIAIAEVESEFHFFTNPTRLSARAFYDSLPDVTEPRLRYREEPRVACFFNQTEFH